MLGVYRLVKGWIDEITGGYLGRIAGGEDDIPVYIA